MEVVGRNGKIRTSRSVGRKIVGHRVLLKIRRDVQILSAAWARSAGRRSARRRRKIMRLPQMKYSGPDAYLVDMLS